MFFSWLPGMAQQVGTSPLEYNPQKFFKTYGTMSDVQQSRSLYPIGSKNFYIYDTLSLPFVDDFSQYHFKNYDQWSWPAPVDSVALIYRLTPQPSSFPFSYTTSVTYTYSYQTTPVLHVDSLLNPAHQLIFFGDSINPFEPVDTFTVYQVTSYRYFVDTLTQTIDSIVITPLGTLGADSTDTINVYFPLPDNAYWVDNYTYPNFTMGVDPPTVGVVTFDGTNEFGEAYLPGSVSSYGIADYLTSKPIDLNYPASDSIYFSFFYQPQGRGYDPATKDSLVLEFYSPVTRQWHFILKIPGTPLDTFRQEMVPITDSKFLQKGFRLRFKNHANLSGNLDHWNVDYVRLDRNRSHADTIIQDVAFVQVQPTILKRYMAMPYTQFLQTNVNAKWFNLMCNLGDVNKDICYKFELRDESGTVLNRYTEDYTPVPSDTNVIQPRSAIGYTTYSRWYEPDFNYNFQLNGWLPLTDSTEFTVKHYLQNFDTDTNAENDTVVVHQRFWNYWAYDDGSAEQAIWLGTPGFMAVKFTNNTPDTLRAIQFYFSPIKEDVSSRFFNIMVWVDNLDSVVYSFSRQIGVIPGDPTAEVNPYNNGYTTFYLQDTVILPAGDFYVGWYQNQTYKINVGFDKNTDSHEYVYYKTTSAWDTISLEGSVMIRPMVGPPFSLQDVGVAPVDAPEDDLLVYPNPTHDKVFYAGDIAEHVSEIRVMDISGKMVFTNSHPVTNAVDFSTYPNGFYFVQFALEGTQRVLTRKIIVSH